MPNVSRRRFSTVALVFVCSLFAVLSQSRKVEVSPQPAMFVPTISATMTDNITAATKVAPGAPITYTVTISNSGTDATGVVFNDTLDANTTLAGGTLTITPVSANDTYSVTGNVRIQPVVSNGVLANDINPNTGNTTGLTASAPVTSTQGGNVTLNADGSFSYNPPAGFTGADSFTYTVTGFGGATATGTVTLNVSGKVWFINNAAAACTTRVSGCGRLTNPYSTLAAFQAENNGIGLNPASNDNIFVYESAAAYTGGVTLLGGQKLIGQDSTSTLATITGITLPTSSDAFPSMNTGGNATTIQNAVGNGVTTNSGNTLNGFTGSNSSGFAILGSSFGTLTVADVSINTTGQALSLTNGSLNATFPSVTSSGGTNNIVLAKGAGILAGTLTISGGALSNATGNAFDLNGGTATISYAGTIASGSARSVNVTGLTGGTVTFSGAVTDTDTGISLTTNTGATINFTGGVGVNSGANAAFTATGGGTVNATQNNTSIVNTLTTTTGRAFNASGVTFGASGVTFRSISANGGTNGIVLTNTSGNFTVSGDGTGHANGSGGTIQNITGSVLGNNPVWLTTVGGTTTLNSMNMSIANNTYSGMHVDNNLGGTATVNVVGCTFTGVGGAGNVGQNKALLQFEAGNTGGSAANLTANVQNSFFYNNRTYGVFATAAGDSLMQVTVNQSGFGTDTNTGAPVNNPGTTITNAPPFSLGITNGSNAQVDYDVTNNTFWGGRGLDGALYAVAISGATTTAGSHLNGFFTGNKIGKAGVLSSGCANNCAGLGLLPGTAGTFNTTVSNNDIRQVNSFGINLKNSVTGATGTTIGHFTNNVITEPDTTGAPALQRALVYDIGNSGGSAMGGCLDATGNTMSGGWQAGAFFRITTNNTTGTLIIPGLLPASGATGAQVDTYIESINPAIGAGNALTSVGGTGPINGGAACSATPIANPADEGAFNTKGNADNLAVANAHWTMQNAQFHWGSFEFKAPNSWFQAQTDNSQPRNTVSGLRNDESVVRYGFGDLRNAFGDSRNAFGDSRNAFGDSRNAFGDSRNAFGDSRNAFGDSRNAFGDSRNGLGDSLSSELSEYTAIRWVSSIVDKLSDMISPTVYSQEANELTEIGTQNFSGETITVNGAGAGFTLPAGKSVTITFQATINVPPAARQVSTQGTVSGSNFASVLTDDPEPAGSANPTVSLINTTVTWNGTTSTDWNTDTNWTPPAGGTQYAPGVSNPAINDVVIPNVGLQPNVGASDITVYSLSVSNGRNLSITSPRILTIGGSPGGDLTLDGIISGGFLRLGTGTHVINNTGGTGSLSSSNLMTLLSGSTTTLNNNLQAGRISVSGSLNITNRTLSLNGTGPATLDVTGGATFTTTGSTVTYNGTSAQQIAGITYNNLTINNAAGVNLLANTTVSGALTMTLGDINTNVSTLTIATGATATRTAGSVIGNMKKDFVLGNIAPDAPDAVFVFPVGTAAGYSPVTANATAASTGSLTVAAFDGTAPATPAIPNATTLNRYWQVTKTGTVTAGMTFQYLDGDVDAGTEPNYRLLRSFGAGSQSLSFPNVPPCPGAGSTCVDTAANTIFQNGVVAFDGFWTAGAATVPTAANVGVSGRVLDTAGLGLSRARVQLTDQNGNVVYAMTNPFGYYRFIGIQAGQDYVMSVDHKLFRFQSRVVSVTDELTEIDFSPSRK